MKKTNSLIAYFRQQRQLLEGQQQPAPASQQVVSETKIADTTPTSQVPVFLDSVGGKEDEVSVRVSSAVENTGDDDGSRDVKGIL